MSGRGTAELATRVAAQAVRSGGRRPGRGGRRDDPTRRAVLVLGVLVAAVMAVPAAVIAMVVLVGGAVSENQSQNGCSLSASVVPAGGQAAAAGGFTGEQLQNASVILQVGQERGVPGRAQAIAVMTALGESGMRNLDYGDDRFGVRNPDGTLTSSIGMFQEQKWYGTVEERLDPVQSSGRFYDRLLAVTGWETLEPTIAAHKAQRNADPYHYQQYWDQSLEVMQLVSGADEQDLSALSQSIQGAAAGAPCMTGSVGNAAVGTGGWANPAVGSKASGFGPRSTGIAGASTYHLGQDIAASCGTQVFAAAAGRVVISGATGWGTGNTIRIEHGMGVDSTYGHLLTGTNLVRVGDTVQAGQQIAGMGGDSRIDPAGAGTSSGCHLHYEVRVSGQAVDPEPFMAQQGVTLGVAAPVTESVAPGDAPDGVEPADVDR
ncbi:M23 family metallopeptidase [Promicromonospora vindobonensis]|uniref:M23 family metallopeptidase n=1 Tax=Promicromonospora vindobonensis TaxID=195748 RepID=A0ABW5VUF0_9MICO